MLIKIDMEGIHGTKGTPQNLGSFAFGTKRQSPPVDKAQIGTKMTEDTILTEEAPEKLEGCKLLVLNL